MERVGCAHHRHPLLPSSSAERAGAHCARACTSMAGDPAKDSAQPPKSLHLDEHRAFGALCAGSPAFTRGLVRPRMTGGTCGALPPLAVPALNWERVGASPGEGRGCGVAACSAQACLPVSDPPGLTPGYKPDALQGVRPSCRISGVRPGGSDTWTPKSLTPFPDCQIQNPINQIPNFAFPSCSKARIMHPSRIHTGSMRGIALSRVRVELLARRNARTRLKATAACVR